MQWRVVVKSGKLSQAAGEHLLEYGYSHGTVDKRRHLPIAFSLQLLIAGILCWWLGTVWASPQWPPPGSSRVRQRQGSRIARVFCRLWFFRKINTQNNCYSCSRLETTVEGRKNKMLQNAFSMKMLPLPDCHQNCKIKSEKIQ